MIMQVGEAGAAAEKASTSAPGGEEREIGGEGRAYGKQNGFITGCWSTTYNRLESWVSDLLRSARPLSTRHVRWRGLPAKRFAS